MGQIVIDFIQMHSYPDYWPPITFAVYYSSSYLSSSIIHDNDPASALHDDAWFRHHPQPK
jgi:hypothetical protein